MDIAAILKAPVLGLYGEKDGGIPLDTVDGMKAALKEGSYAAKTSEFVIYPMRPTPSMPTTGPATGRIPRRTAGAECWAGSSTMAWCDAVRRSNGKGTAKSPSGLFDGFMKRPLTQ